MSKTPQKPLRSVWRWLIVAALLSALTVIGYRWIAERSRLARLAEEYNAAVKSRQRFQTEVVFADSKATSLLDLFAGFKQQTGIEVHWRSDSAEMKRYLKAPIDCQLPPLTAFEWLETVGKLRNFTWRERSDGNVILYGEVKDEPRYWQNYALPDGPQISVDEWLDLLTSKIDPDEWDSVGGPRAAEETPAGVTTYQPLRGHLRTERFMQRLSAACRQAKERVPALKWNAVAGEPICLDCDREAFQRLQQALDCPIILKAVNMPYAEFVERLSAQAKFPITSHENEVLVRNTQEEVAHQGLINCELQGVPLRDVLRTWQPKLQLEFAIGAEGRLLVIFDRKDRRQLYRFETETLFAYPVADLVKRDGEYFIDELIDLITNTLGTELWKDVSGAGRISSCADGELLLISHNLEACEPILELLTKLRQVRSGAVRHAVLSPIRPLPVMLPAMRERLAEAKAIDLRAVREPDATQTSNIRIPAALFSDARRVWAHLPKRPLRENLQLLLAASDVELHHLEQVTELRDDGHFDDSRLEVCEIFDLRPWLATQHTPLSVGDLLTAAVDPDSWQDLGGLGSCAQFQETLVVCAHPRVMARIKLFLKVLEEYTASGNQRWRGQQLAGEALNSPLDLFGDSDAAAIQREWFVERSDELLQKLQEKATFKIESESRGDALLKLARQFDLPLVLQEVPYGLDGDAIVPANATTALDIKVTDLVSIDAQAQPLVEVLQQLIGDPREQQIVVVDGVVRIDKTGAEPQPDWVAHLYCVDDLVAPRGTLLPLQLSRTLEEAQYPMDSSAASAPRQPVLNAHFQFGNLLHCYHLGTPEVKARIEQTLRELRSGQRKALPAMPDDLPFNSIPQRRRPYRTSPIPVVGEFHE
ncbi:hypothetical protein [Anatilimnocola floriformis]|uniref:hypothetical protein n=1 Tax=Anatilimnocola floriformis TaxID=2948575 RepID=UPI0020C30B69|nr:hypothetical protein [Anatilimnocola floriformis]